MTNYHWIYYDKENINELYEQDEKITQQELMNEKQQEQMNQTKIRAQELFNQIITMNPYINENKPMCYYLNPPGGHIESRASRRQTLIQETLEEASILQYKNDYTFEFTQRFTEQKETRDKGIRIIFVYSSYTDQEPITPSEEQENLSQWELYTLQDIFTYKTVDSFREYIIRKLQEIPVCINHISARGEGRILHPSIGQINHHYLRELCKKYKK